MQRGAPFSRTKATAAARAHAGPSTASAHWTASLLDPEANARQMESRNRANDLHPGSPNLLPSTGGIPAAGGTRLVMEGSIGLCLDAGSMCRQHRPLSSLPSRPSPALVHLLATRWPIIGLARPRERGHAFALHGSCFMLHMLHPMRSSTPGLLQLLLGTTLPRPPPSPTSRTPR
jgi:hypothetical protein